MILIDDKNWIIHVAAVTSLEWTAFFMAFSLTERYKLNTPATIKADPERKYTDGPGRDNRAQNIRV